MTQAPSGAAGAPVPHGTVTGAVVAEDERRPHQLGIDIERWDKAVNLESPGQFEAIHTMLEHHADDVAGLHLAGEYLFLIACTEGAFATGQKAPESVAKAQKAMIG